MAVTFNPSTDRGRADGSGTEEGGGAAISTLVFDAGKQRVWDRVYRGLGLGEFAGLHSEYQELIVRHIFKRDPISAEQAMRSHLEAIARAIRRDAGL